MKICLLRFVISLILLSVITPLGKSIDSLKYKIALNYFSDLSDTYDGGDLFSCEFKLSKSWYGAQISFGYFHSYSVFKYQVFIDELNRSLIIPFDEISIMKTGSLSLIFIPIQNRIITTDVLLGLVLGGAKSSQFHDVEYSYSFIDNKFNYLYKNYELVEKIHFGYQVGFTVSFSITRKFGLQISSRIQDLSNGGTFFFVGGGLCFRL